MRIYKLLLKKRFKKAVIYFGILLLISIILTQLGIGKIKSIHQEEKYFSNLENQLVERYINFHQYGGYGIRLKYSPEPIAALFAESAPFLNINAFMDIGVRLYIYSELSPDNALDQKGYLDFFWFFAVVGSLLVSVWGWNVHNDKDRMKFLTSINSRRIFVWKLLPGLTLIFLGILMIYGQILVQFWINGYSIDAVHLGVYLGVVLLAYFVWFSFAAFMGCGNQKNRKIYFAIIWFVLVMLMPEIFKMYFNREAKVIITCKYNHELKMVEILMRFEKKAFAKSERLITKEEKFKVSVESAGEYLRFDAKELERLQKELLNSLEKEIGKYNFICQLTIMTFLKTAAVEISAQGYNGYQRFNLYALNMQMKFLKFITEKLYFKAPFYGPVHSFQKEGENIFRFRSTLPRFFLLGLFWHLSLFLVVIWMNLRKSKEFLFYQEPEKINDLDLSITEGTPNILLTANKELKQHLFSYFEGKTELKGELTIKTSKEVKGSGFIYLYKKAEMDADFTPDEMRMLLDEHGEETENWKIIFKHAKRTGKILLMVDFIDGLRKSEIMEVVDYIKKEKLMSLLITDRDIAFKLVPGNKILYMPNDNSIEIIEEI